MVFPSPPVAPITGEDLPAAKQMAPRLGLAEHPLETALYGNVTTRELYRAIVEASPIRSVA